MSIFRKTYSVSVSALVVANIVPLLGVLFANWRVFDILALFWLENVVVGFLNIAKMVLARGGNPSNEIKSVFMVIQKLAAIPFFTVHYGGFVAIHGVFLFMGMRELFGDTSTSTDPKWLALTVAGLAVSHGISFFVNYIGRGEFRRTTISMLMGRPYGRVVAMHVTIIFGGFVVMSSGNPVWMVILLILIKVGIDLKAHLSERKKFAATTDAD
jgi:hypothetical protein